MDTATSKSEMEALDLAIIVAGMSRFLTRLTNMPSFQEAGLGLAEWSALSIVTEKHGLNSRQLANILGITAQRINQIMESLRVRGLISLNSSPDDARKKIISVTPAGAAKLQALNAKLQPIIAAALSDRPQLLSRANRVINGALMRIVLPPKPVERPRR